MKKFDLEQMGVQEMNATETKETDGGILPFLIAAALLALAGCRTAKEIPGSQYNDLDTLKQ